MTPVQATTLIYYPRVFMTLCSLVIDFTLIKTSELLGLDGTSVLLCFNCLLDKDLLQHDRNHALFGFDFPCHKVNQVSACLE
jgi:hypothetical protein